MFAKLFSQKMRSPSQVEPPNQPRKPMEIYEFQRRRMLAIFAVVGLVLAIIAGRLFQLHYAKREEFMQKVENQRSREVTLFARRGRILDRKGRILAVSLPTQSLGADCTLISDPDPVARELASILDMNEATLRRKLGSERAFVWIKRQLTLEEEEKCRAMKERALIFKEDFRRVYPQGDIAAQVIGWAGVDNQGLEGIEYHFDDVLAGKDGKVVGVLDGKKINRTLLSSLAGDSRPAQDGADVILTIDSVIQEILQKELEEVYDKKRPLQAMGIVTEPISGHILAVASYPGVDLNHFEDSAKENRKLKPITDYFEPGSAFKIVTAAAALETGIPSYEMIDCENGYYRYRGVHTFHDTKRMGEIPFQEVIVFSSNIGTVKLAEMMGEESLLYYAKAFGFGQPTGVEFPLESRGVLREPGNPRWSKLSLGSLAIGQEVGVSAAQLNTAVSTVANRGIYVPPRLVLWILPSEEGNEPFPPIPDLTELQPESWPERIYWACFGLIGNLTAFEEPWIDSGLTASGKDEMIERIGRWQEQLLSKPEQRRVFSSRNALILAEMLRETVERGTGTWAQLPHHFSAGKTGTAQKYDQDTKSYSKNIAVFTGFAPVDESRIAITIVVDEPTVGDAWGGIVAAPVFRRVAEQVLNYLSVPPDFETGIETESQSGQVL